MVPRLSPRPSAALPPRLRLPLRRLLLAILAALLLTPVGLALHQAHLEIPAPTPLLRARDGRFLNAVGEGPQGFWTVKPRPDRVVAATLALEDRRFYRHFGVDPIGVARAIWQNLRHAHRVSGASTLAMQVARMQHPGPRTLLRKGVEALTACFLTLRYGREAILDQYLRLVPYGNRIHGIAYAARRYLDKPVEDLSWAEVAFLSALPQAPSRMNPFTPAGRVQAVARAQRILQALYARGALSDATLALARHELADLRLQPREPRPGEAMHAILSLETAVSRALTAGGLEKPLVDTTLDLEMQQVITQEAAKAVRAWAQEGAGNAAVLVVDRQGFQVRAAVGSTGYFDAQARGAIDYTRVPRFAGSTLKPFLYGLALEKGLITPATPLEDLARGPEGITNADQLYLGPLLPRAALATSRNIPAIALLRQLGLDPVYSLLRRLGLHDGSLPATHWGLGMAIGGIPVTLERLARAYTVLAGDGRVQDLVWFQGQKMASPERILEADTVRLLSLYLSDPNARLPVFPRMGWTDYPFPVAVKTGTSSSYRDSWALLWSRRYLVGVWVGHPDYRPMRGLSGYRGAARLAHSVLMRLHPDEARGLEDLSFPPPADTKPVKLCPLTGDLAGPDCDTSVLEWLTEAQTPPRGCQAHVRLAVDRRDGRLAGPKTPRGAVEVRTVVRLEPRFAAWAAAAGLPTVPLGLSGLEGEDPRAMDGLSSPGLETDAKARRAEKGGVRGGEATSPRGMGATGDSAGNGISRGHPAAIMGGVTASPLALRAGQPVRLRITSPPADAHLVRDPELPADQATLSLSVVVEPPVSQILWSVDGQPFRLVDHPYATRWPVTPGEHVFQARVPMTELVSAPVRVYLQ